MTSENHSLSGDCGRLSAAQNRNLPTLCNLQTIRSSAALFPGKSNKQTCKQTNPLSSSSITTNTSLTFCWWFLIPLRYIPLRKRKHIKMRLGTSLGPVGWQWSKGKGNGTTKKKKKKPCLKTLVSYLLPHRVKNTQAEIGIFYMNFPNSSITTSRFKKLALISF